MRPGLPVGGGVSTSPSEVQRAPRRLWLVSAAAVEIRDLQGEWHLPRIMWALSEVGMTDQAAPGNS